MFRRRDKNQFSFLEDNKRFVVDINPENRWVKLSGLMPWDRIEDHYAQNMCENNGRDAITSRIAFGSIFAKENLTLTDVGAVEHISENPYLQYFLGLQEYQGAPLFDASMMVHFRKRFTPEFISCREPRRLAAIAPNRMAANAGFVAGRKGQGGFTAFWDECKTTKRRAFFPGRRKPPEES